MKKILFSTNLPSPYRVDFFNELGKYCNLTVLYERRRSDERDAKWVGAEAKTFNEKYLDLVPVGADRSKGAALREYIKKADFDILVFTNYVSPATIEAIAYCRLHRVPYYIEYDGGFNKKDSFYKYVLKKFLLGGAKGHLTTAEEHRRYLMSLGIKEESIFKYPFTSVNEKDIEKAGMISNGLKAFYRDELGIKENKMILSVGRFSYENGYGKGFDVLLKTSKELDLDIGIYIVGDEPTEEFVKIKKDQGLSNVHFVGFKTKEELYEYYAAADLFVLLTRGDIWGLVINEAMMFGLPVITTSSCIAGTELIENNRNGFIVSINDISGISQKIKIILKDAEIRKKFSEESLARIQGYSIENMAARQAKFFLGGLLERESFARN